MKYEKRTVCYFDILGFGDTVCKKILNAESIEKLFKEIQLIAKDSDKHDIQVSYFSDSFVISTLSQFATHLEFIIDILAKLLEFKLLARGAIVYGELIHKENYVFGPALVKAVNIEKCTFYPRIILDESITERPLDTIGNSLITYAEYFNDFIFVKKDSRDRDSKYYIDIIGEINKKEKYRHLINTLDGLIQKYINNEMLREKYLWLQEKNEEAKTNCKPLILKQ